MFCVFKQKIIFTTCFNFISKFPIQDETCLEKVKTTVDFILTDYLIKNLQVYFLVFNVQELQGVFTYSQEPMVSLSSAGFKFTSLVLVAHLKMIEWFYSRASLSTSKNERKEYQQIKLAYMVQKNNHWY